MNSKFCWHYISVRSLAQHLPVHIAFMYEPRSEKTGLRGF